MKYYYYHYYFIYIYKNMYVYERVCIVCIHTIIHKVRYFITQWVVNIPGCFN